MAILPIRLFPDPVLRKRSKPLGGKEAWIESFVKNLLETLYAQPNGIGIAAPQVGEPRRMIVVDVSPKDVTKHQQVMINPVIKAREGQILSREGCMSLPDYTANIVRSEKVLVEWTDLSGKKHQKSASGIEAVCLQHEIDHLNGVLFIDRAGSLKTDVFPRKRRR